MSASPQVFQIYQKKRLSSQQSSSDLKGFRKGNAPLDVIEKYYGDQITTQIIYESMADIFYKKVWIKLSSISIKISTF